MADSGVPSPKQTIGGPPQYNMEGRLLIALLAMMGVFLISQYLFKSPPGPKPVKPNQTTTAQQAKKPAEPPAVSPAAPVAAASDAKPSTTAVTAAGEESPTIETDLYKIQFSNKGATVRSWQLKKYRNSHGKPLELVNQAIVGKSALPFSYEFPSGQDIDLSQKLFAVHQQPDQLGLDFEFSDGKLQAKKSFRFKKDSYLSEYQSAVSRDGRPVPHMTAWRGGFGDEEVLTAATNQHALYYDLNANKLTVNDVKAAKNGPVTNGGTYSFAGLEDTFFAAVFLPKDRTPMQIVTENAPVYSERDKKDVPRIGAAVSSDANNQFGLFVGPKDTDLLAKVDPKLDRLVDWGWFEIIAKPLFLSLKYINDHWTHNYGWAIILITVIINMALLPLKISSMRSSKKMQALAPQIAVINEKYKGLSMRDPKKQDQSAETMALYSKHGVNPAGGCLTLLPQLPVFFAFFKVLSVAIELRGAPWLWVTDLSQPETLPIRILPIIMIASQIFQQKMTPNAGMDPSQQRMMYIMPIFFGYIFYGFASGLVLYYLTANLVGIVQQWAFNRFIPMPVIPSEPSNKLKKSSRK